MFTTHYTQFPTSTSRHHHSFELSTRTKRSWPLASRRCCQFSELDVGKSWWPCLTVCSGNQTSVLLHEHCDWTVVGRSVIQTGRETVKNSLIIQYIERWSTVTTLNYCIHRVRRHFRMSLTRLVYVITGEFDFRSLHICSMSTRIRTIVA